MTPLFVAALASLSLQAAPALADAAPASPHEVTTVEASPEEPLLERRLYIGLKQVITARITTPDAGLEFLMPQRGLAFEVFGWGLQGGPMVRLDRRDVTGRGYTADAHLMGGLQLGGDPSSSQFSPMLGFITSTEGEVTYWFRPSTGLSLRAQFALAVPAGIMGRFAVGMAF